MDAIKNLPVVELSATELSTLVGGEGQDKTKEMVKVSGGSCGGSTSATATVKVGR
jgi:hypothetical protein